jgi:hypothetical protein
VKRSNKETAFRAAVKRMASLSGGLWKTRPAVSLSASSSSAETGSDGGWRDDRVPFHAFGFPTQKTLT